MEIIRMENEIIVKLGKRLKEERLKQRLSQ